MKHRFPRAALLLLAIGALASPDRGQLPAASQAPAPVETQASIPRAVFETWITRGPQYLLSQVVPMPITRQKHFEGFRLSQWFPRHPEVAEGAIRLGDVILRINGRSVERPDQFLYVWKQLNGASSVVIEGLRDGNPLKATLTIVDDPAGPAANPPASEPATGTP